MLIINVLLMECEVLNLLENANLSKKVFLYLMIMYGVV